MGSSSSDVEIENSHKSSKPQTKTSSSVDGAIIMKHYVKKPIISKVYETLAPRRIIYQSVMPVKEFIKTVVAQEKNGGDDGGGETTTEASDNDQYE